MKILLFHPSPFMLLLHLLHHTATSRHFHHYQIAIESRAACGLIWIFFTYPWLHNLSHWKNSFVCLIFEIKIIILTIFSICRSRAESNYSKCIFERDNLLSWKIVTELADRILFFFLLNTLFDYSFDLIGDHVPCRKKELHHFQWFEFSNALGSIFRPSSGEYRSAKVK